MLALYDRQLWSVLLPPRVVSDMHDVHSGSPVAGSPHVSSSVHGYLPGPPARLDPTGGTRRPETCSKYLTGGAGRAWALTGELTIKRGDTQPSRSRVQRKLFLAWLSLFVTGHHLRSDFCDPIWV